MKSELKINMNMFNDRGKSVFILKILKKKFNNLIKKTYYLAFGLAAKLPAKKKTVMFESYGGKQYSCNPRAIYEYMIDHYKDYHLFWSVNPHNVAFFEQQGIPYIKRFSLKWLFYVARAEYWVVNSRMPLWIPKPKHTTYLQTWHGTPLKRLAADMDEVHMPGTNTERYKKNFIKEAKKWDYLISPNEYSTKIFKRAFEFNGEMLNTGYPRNDVLYKKVDHLKNDIRQRLEIKPGKKVILYAPTWRDNEFYAKGKYKFQLNFDIESMKKHFGDECIILLRMHYLVAENFDFNKYKGFIHDVSSYPDIRELYIISDILITDYSSVFFDFANLKKPIIFFTYDIENYRDTLRGFYFDLEKEAPGALVYNEKELIEEIQKGIKESKLNENYIEFYDKYCAFEDGNAAERVVKAVFEENRE